VVVIVVMIDEVMIFMFSGFGVLVRFGSVRFDLILVDGWIGIDTPLCAG